MHEVSLIEEVIALAEQERARQPFIRIKTIRLEVGSTVSVLPPVRATSPTVAGPGTQAATTTVPTPGGQKPSSSTDQLEPWDPTPCPAS